MNGSVVVFYLLALFTILNAILAVTSRLLFRAAIFLLFTLVGIAGLYFWMHLEFIAAVQIIVYVGGITVLIIFSIFLTQQAGERLPGHPVKHQLFAALAVVAGFALLMNLVAAHSFQKSKGVPFTADVGQIGEQMLNTGNGGYALPFEVVSILLLAALVGCIVIAMRSRPVELQQTMK